MLLSQREEFLDNHLPRVPITPNQQGAFEKREEVLPSVGAQEANTTGYEVSDLEHTEFSWEDPAVNMVSVNRPRIDAPFSPSMFDDFQMGSTAANPILVDDGQHKEILAPTTTTAESDHPAESPRLLLSRPFGTRLENKPDSVYRALFC